MTTKFEKISIIALTVCECLLIAKLLCVSYCEDPISQEKSKIEIDEKNLLKSITSQDNKNIYTLVYNHHPLRVLKEQHNFLHELNAGKSHNRWEILKEDQKVLFLLSPRGEIVKTIRAGAVLKQVDITADEKIHFEYQLADYTPEHPYVIQNPYGTTQLTALIRFKTEKPSNIRLTIHGIGGAPDLSFKYPPKIEHALPVFGLYPKTKNKLTLTVQEGKIKKNYPLTIQTDTPKRTSLYHPFYKKDKNNHFYHSYDGIIYDEYGYIRYILDTGSMAYINPKEIITENARYGLTRWTPLGKRLDFYPYPSGFYSYAHGINRMPNGNFLVIGTQEGTKAHIQGTLRPTHRDIIIELDYRTKKEVKRWDLAQILNPDRSVIVKSSQEDYGACDWIHTNSIQYIPEDNSLLFSGRHIGMFKIDYETGDLKWTFGPKLGYEKSGRDGKGPALWNKILTAVDRFGNKLPLKVQQGIQTSSQFQWPTTTHHARYIGNGYYSIFNNNYLTYDSRIHADQNSHGMIFKIDEKNKTIRQVWSELTGLYTGPGSNVNVLPKSKDIVVYLSEVFDKNSNRKYGRLYRYKWGSKKLLYEAILHRLDNSYYYRLEPLDMRTLLFDYQPLQEE